MNIDQFISAIALCHEARVACFGWGPKGLGKSTAPKAYAKSKFHFGDKVPYGVRVLHAAQIEGSDLRGLPMADVENNATIFLPPKDLPQHEFIDEDGVTFGKPGDAMPELSAGGKKVALWRGVLVLDELNRAEDDVIQAIFELITENKCGGYTMPTGWSIIAAGNQSGAKYRVNSMVNDAAFISRFSHLMIEVDEKYRNGWLGYMHELDSDPLIAEAITQFCCFKDEHLCVTDGEVDDIVIEPNPRAWEYVLRIENAAKRLGTEQAVRGAVINGLLGMAVGAAYMEFNAPVTPQQILDHGVTSSIEKILSDKDKVSRSAVQAILHGLASKAGKIKEPNEKQINNVFSFGRWLIKHGDSYRDLATAYFRALTGPELKQSLKGAAMVNNSIRALIQSKNLGGVWYNALSKDPSLFEYVRTISSGTGSGSK